MNKLTNRREKLSLKQNRSTTLKANKQRPATIAQMLKVLTYTFKTNQIKYPADYEDEFNRSMCHAVYI